MGWIPAESGMAGHPAHYQYTTSPAYASQAPCPHAVMRNVLWAAMPQAEKAGRAAWLVWEAAAVESVRQIHDGSDTSGMGHGMLTDMPLTHCGHAAVADTSGIIGA